MLSCVADVTAKVECLDLGARDYLTKPFALDELIARVRVQLRSNCRDARGDDHERRSHPGSLGGCRRITGTVAFR